MTERVFTVSKASKIVYSLLLAAFPIAMVCAYFYKKTVSVTMAGDILIFLVITAELYIAVMIFRNKIIVSDYSIVYIKGLWHREVLNNDVKGFRIVHQHVDIGPALSLRSRIRINLSEYGDSDELLQILREKYVDLNAVDRESAYNNLLQQQDLAVTPEVLKNNLDQAKTVSMIYNFLGGCFFVLVLFDHHFFLSILLMIYPLLSIVIMKHYAGLVKVLSNSRRGIYPQLGVGIYIPTCILMIEACSALNFLDYGPMFIPMFTITLLFLLALCWLGYNRSAGAVKGQFIAILVLCFMYGIGSSLELNCVFDRSTPQVFHATVVEQFVREKGKKNYFLTLNKWGPQSAGKTLQVPAAIYWQASKNPEIRVCLKKGLFNMPWYYIEE